MLPIGIVYAFLAGFTGLIAGWSAYHCSDLVFNIRMLAGLKPLVITATVPTATTVPHATATLSEAVPRATATLNHAWTPQYLLLDMAPSNKVVRVPVDAVYYQYEEDAALHTATATPSPPTTELTSVSATPLKTSFVETASNVPVLREHVSLATILVVVGISFTLFVLAIAVTSLCGIAHKARSDFTDAQGKEQLALYKPEGTRTSYTDAVLPSSPTDNAMHPETSFTQSQLDLAPGAVSPPVQPNNHSIELNFGQMKLAVSKVTGLVRGLTHSQAPVALHADLASSDSITTDLDNDATRAHAHRDSLQSRLAAERPSAPDLASGASPTQTPVHRRKRRPIVPRPKRDHVSWIDAGLIRSSSPETSLEFAGTLRPSSPTVFAEGVSVTVATELPESNFNLPIDKLPLDSTPSHDCLPSTSPQSISAPATAEIASTLVQAKASDPRLALTPAAVTTSIPEAATVTEDVANEPVLTKLADAIVDVNTDEDELDVSTTLNVMRYTSATQPAPVKAQPVELHANGNDATTNADEHRSSIQSKVEAGLLTVADLTHEDSSTPVSPLSPKVKRRQNASIEEREARVSEMSFIPPQRSYRRRRLPLACELDIPAFATLLVDGPIATAETPVLDLSPSTHIPTLDSSPAPAVHVPTSPASNIAPTTAELAPASAQIDTSAPSLALATPAITIGTSERVIIAEDVAEKPALEKVVDDVVEIKINENELLAGAQVVTHFTPTAQPAALNASLGEPTSEVAQEISASEPGLKVKPSPRPIPSPLVSTAQGDISALFKKRDAYAVADQGAVHEPEDLDADRLSYEAKGKWRATTPPVEVPTGAQVQQQQQPPNEDAQAPDGESEDPPFVLPANISQEELDAQPALLEAPRLKPRPSPSPPALFLLGSSKMMSSEIMQETPASVIEPSITQASGISTSSAQEHPQLGDEGVLPSDEHPPQRSPSPSLLNFYEEDPDVQSILWTQYSSPTLPASILREEAHDTEPRITELPSFSVSATQELPAVPSNAETSVIEDFAQAQDEHMFTEDDIILRTISLSLIDDLEKLDAQSLASYLSPTPPASSPWSSEQATSKVALGMGTDSVKSPPAQPFSPLRSSTHELPADAHATEPPTFETSGQSQEAATQHPENMPDAYINGVAPLPTHAPIYPSSPQVFLEIDDAMDGSMIEQSFSEGVDAQDVHMQGGSESYTLPGMDCDADMFNDEWFEEMKNPSGRMDIDERSGPIPAMDVDLAGAYSPGLGYAPQQLDAQENNAQLRAIFGGFNVPDAPPVAQEPASFDVPMAQPDPYYPEPFPDHPPLASEMSQSYDQWGQHTSPPSHGAYESGMPNCTNNFVPPRADASSSRLPRTPPAVPELAQPYVQWGQHTSPPSHGAYEAGMRNYTDDFVPPRVPTPGPSVASSSRLPRTPSPPPRASTPYDNWNDLDYDGEDDDDSPQPPAGGAAVAISAPASLPPLEGQAKEFDDRFRALEEEKRQTLIERLEQNRKAKEAKEAEERDNQKQKKEFKVLFRNSSTKHLAATNKRAPFKPSVPARLVNSNIITPDITFPASAPSFIHPSPAERGTETFRPSQQSYGQTAPPAFCQPPNQQATGYEVDPTPKLPNAAQPTASPAPTAPGTAATADMGPPPASLVPFTRDEVKGMDLVEIQAFWYTKQTTVDGRIWVKNVAFRHGGSDGVALLDQKLAENAAAEAQASSMDAEPTASNSPSRPTRIVHVSGNDVRKVLKQKDKERQRVLAERAETEKERLAKEKKTADRRRKEEEDNRILKERLAQEGRENGITSDMPVSIIKSQLPTTLFAALDRQTDAQIEKDRQATLELMKTLASSFPKAGNYATAASREKMNQHPASNPDSSDSMES